MVSRRIAIAIILSTAIVIASIYFNDVDGQHYTQRLELHNQIIHHTAPSPYRYRILVPYTIEAVIHNTHTRTAFFRAYAVFDTVAISLMLLSLFAFLSMHFKPDLPLIGTLFVAATMPIALRNHYFQPWSLLEPGLFALALIYMLKNKTAMLYTVAITAILNRETGVIIPMAYLFHAKNKTKPIILASVCVAILVLLRYTLGYAPQIHTIHELFHINTIQANVLRAVANNAMFLGALWVLAILGYKHAPTPIKKIALIVPIQIALLSVFNLWYETRQLMTLYPVLIALGLFYVTKPKRS